MDNDIVPELLAMIEKEFDSKTLQSSKLKKAIKLLQSKKATYLDANDFAIEVGEILADVLSDSITSKVLPDGKMYYNIAERILNSTLEKNFSLISGYAIDVQAQLNHNDRLRMRAQSPTINQDRIDGIINKLTSYDDFESAKWLLDEPVVNFSQSIVDETIKVNAEFHAKAGLQPIITRRVAGHACEWCKNLAGTYDYYDAPDDIYRRHKRCRCTVEYKPGNGRRQDVWSKDWKDPDRSSKLEMRKNIGISQANFEELSFFELADMQDYSDKWYNNLVENELDGVEKYTRNGFESMNTFLRGFDGFSESVKNEIQQNITNFSSALSKFSLQKDIITFRGVSAREYDKILKGNIFKDFKSTSTAKEQALTFAKNQSEDYIVTFKIPKGTNGAYLGTNSAYKNESEFTLNKDSKYKVKKTPKGLEVTIIE